MIVKFIKPTVIIETPLEGFLSHIERAGRTCYKSEDKITDDSSKEFVSRIIKLGHESVLEHCSFSVRFVTDRGVTHELVRHRLASFSQESTRYCNYNNKGLEFIIPPWCNIGPTEFIVNEYIRTSMLGSFSYCDYLWADTMVDTALNYKMLLEKGWSPQQARSVLPNSLKTEIVTSANLREWRHILKLRTSNAAHPQIREIMLPLLAELKKKVPVVFDDITGVEL